MNAKCDWAGFCLELLFAKIRLHLAIYMVLCVFHKISSIPPLDLGERGRGRTRMRKKSGRRKMFWGPILDASGVF